jgi:hypothetical protein
MLVNQASNAHLTQPLRPLAGYPQHNVGPRAGQGDNATRQSLHGKHMRFASGKATPRRSSSRRTFF